MSILAAISALFSPVAKVVTTISDNKTKVKQQHIDRLLNADDKLAEWELIQAEKPHRWREDWFSILLSIPLVGAFFPSVADDILAGFEVLNKMPEYYQYWVAVAILSSFGIRALKK